MTSEGTEHFVSFTISFNGPINTYRVSHDSSTNREVILCVEKNVSKRKNEIFPSKPSFSRKSSLKISLWICLTADAIEGNNWQKIIPRAKNNYNPSVRRSVFEKTEFENLSSAWRNIFKVHFLENDALSEKQILLHISSSFSRVERPRVDYSRPSSVKLAKSKRGW